jgi:asparagine synthase (glutamine-hydrolysing)
VDVASMGFSLEARCPLTDYRLVEWAMRLPLSHKLRGRQTKYLLRRALARHLPAHIAMRPKTGFGMPVAALLRGPLREWARDLIYDDGLLSSLPLDRPALRALFELHVRGTRDAHPLLWGALMLIGHHASHRADASLPDFRPLRAA